MDHQSGIGKGSNHRDTETGRNTEIFIGLNGRHPYQLWVKPIADKDDTSGSTTIIVQQNHFHFPSLLEKVAEGRMRPSLTCTAGILFGIIKNLKPIIQNG